MQISSMTALGVGRWWKRWLGHIQQGTLGLQILMMAACAARCDVAYAAGGDHSAEKQADALDSDAHRLALENRHQAAAYAYEAACALRSGLLPRGIQLSKLVVCTGRQGLMHWRLKHYDEALTFFRQALELQEQILPADDIAIAGLLLALASIHVRLSHHSTALELLERVLSIQQRALGPKRLEISQTLILIGRVKAAQGNFEEARGLLRRALSIRRRHLPPDDPLIADTLHDMASVSFAQGRLDEAERLLEQAYATHVRMLGREHIATAYDEVRLADVYLYQGSFERAALRLTHAIRVFETTWGSEHFSVADTLFRLGRVQRQRGNHEDAQQLYERALIVLERALGPDDPDVARTLNELALAYQAQGRHQDAEPLLMRALDITERTLGNDHPGVAAVESNIARLYYAIGEHEDAASHCERALSINEAVLGNDHPDVAASLSDMAIINLALGRRASAIERFRRALAIEDAHLSRTLMVADESRRVAHASQLLVATHQAVSLHLQAAPHDHAATELALTTLLRRKGRVQELVSRSHAALRQSLPPEHQHLLHDLALVRAEYAALSYMDPATLHPERVTTRLAAVQQQQDELWAALAAHSPAIERLSDSVTIADVRAAVPEDGALVEYFLYRPQFDALGVLMHDPGPPRYAAYLVLPTHIDWVDLGPAALIDEGVSTFRDAILHERDAPRDLYDAVMGPVLERVGPVRQLFVSPDGALSRIPFGALHDGEAYLVERHGLRYLAAGRNILRPWRSSKTENGIVLTIANPTGAELPGTEREARLLATMFPSTLVLLGADATEARARRVTRPRMIHVGTHGFHLGRATELELEAATTDRMRSGLRGHEAPASAVMSDPMLRSGLLLATDTNSPIGRDDGRLTAYEVSDWDLLGTELVVLSACGTGLGAIQMGEGVMGLQRAFTTAGAQTLVTSLWDLGDDSAPEVMERYYRNLAAGVGRGDAMQQAQLELLHAGHPPREWAAFVVEGEWAPLSWVAPAEEGPPSITRPRGCQASIGAPGDALGLVMLGLFALVSRRRRLRTVLGTALLAAACAPSHRGSSPPSPPPRVDARTLASWVRGEPRRPIPVDARGASLGLQKVELDSDEPLSDIAAPGSCGKELRSLLSIPGEPGVVLVSNVEGELFRYEDGARHIVTADVALPPVGMLLGLEAETSPLHLLVSSRDGTQLWELEIGGNRVLEATLLGEGLPVGDRAAFLERYWVGRCLPGSRGCLALVHDDEQLSLDRRPHPRAEPEIVMPLGQAFVADVSYGDAGGTWVYLLTAAVCEADAEASAEPTA